MSTAAERQALYNDIIGRPQQVAVHAVLEELEAAEKELARLEKITDRRPPDCLHSTQDHYITGRELHCSDCEEAFAGRLTATEARAADLALRLQDAQLALGREQMAREAAEERAVRGGRCSRRTGSAPPIWRARARPTTATARGAASRRGTTRRSATVADNYEAFLATKLELAPAAVPVRAEAPISAALFSFQRASVEWALSVGRAALFLDCGMGKTACQLEWARHVIDATRGRVLVLAPLAVAQQTVREAAKFGIEACYAREPGEARSSIVVTNYERAARFEPSSFSGVVLDESSILKAFMGKTKRWLLEAFAHTPYRLCCTATPAPNDHLELGNHAEFLGVLTSHEMIARWFINDTSTFGTYRLKHHAVAPFWRWVTSWARCAGRPSDLGEYSDEGYVLPELRVERHLVDVDVVDGRGEHLFRQAELSATAVHAERRRTAAARATRLGEVVAAEPGEPWLLWCETDYEADALTAAIPEAVEVRGSMSVEEKERRLSWFAGTYEEPCLCQSAKSGAPTIEPGASKTETASASIDEPPQTSATHGGESSTENARTSERRHEPKRGGGRSRTQISASPSASSRTASPSSSTASSSPRREEAAPSADARSVPTVPSARRAGRDASTSTTAMPRGVYAASSAPPATSASESSATMLSSSSEPPCTCGRLTARRAKILISKPRVAGWGLNFQHCARVAFAGPTFSYEAYYQAIRRSWRFGQPRPVVVHVAMAATEREIWNVMVRKADDHEAMKRHMFAAARAAQAVAAPRADYLPTHTVELPGWICAA